MLFWICLFFAIVNGGHAADWTYADVSHWGGICESGKSQSPIDLDLRNFEQNCDLDAFELDWNVPENLELVHNNHTVQLNIPDKYAIRLTGGGLGAAYVLKQLHFHWAFKDHCNLGSEHTVDGLAYPVEVHFVHVKEGLTLAEALEVSDGLAVLGAFFKLETGAGTWDSRGVEKLLPYLIKVQHNDIKEAVPVPRFSPYDLLPEHRDTYFRYNGSLTTPPCSESVIWTVFTEPIPINETQLNAFRSVQEFGQDLENFRPIQPMNDRKLLLRTKQCAVSSCAKLCLSFVIVIFVLIAGLL